jgi:predicted Zn-dependent protease
MNTRPIHFIVLAPVIAIGAACSDRPKAPPLTAEAVFQNEQIGLRFLAPAGWPVRSRAVLPTGQLAKPIVLVSYQRVGGERLAEFSVLVADLPPDANLEQFVAEHRVGAEQWAARPPSRQVTVNGVSATRCLLTRVQGKEEIHREVTAFRRGERVYFFLVVFAASDASSRDAVRVAVESVTWTK